MTDNARPYKTGANRHPVDQLADVRARIKTLQDREAELKSEISAMMGGADSLGGDEFIASQRLQSRKGGLDEKKLAAAVGDLEAYRKPDSTFVVIRTELRAREAA